MHVCMFVLYVCMEVCMYVYVSIYVCMYLCMCMYACMYACKMCMHVCIYVYAYIPIFLLLPVFGIVLSQRHKMCTFFLIVPTCVNLNALVQKSATGCGVSSTSEDWPTNFTKYPDVVVETS